jgi:hypothetical protein
MPPAVSSPRTFAALATAVAAACSAAASADITIHTYTNASNYHYRVTHMPDLDQVRDDCCAGGLGNDGLMYCVPTGTFNLFAYAANHGFSFMQPGAHNWQSNANYGLATSWILSLGITMGTNPITGTGGGWDNGTYNYLSTYAPFMTASFFYLNDDYTPRAFRMAKKGTQGGIIAFVYGRYQVIGSFQGKPLVQRTGGHCVTLNESKADGNGIIIRYRDPADVPINTFQDPFATKEVTATAVDLAFDTDSEWVRTVTAIAYPSSDGKYRVIDGFVVVKPIFGLSFQNTGGNFVLDKIAPIALEGLGGGTINLNSLGPIFGVSELLHDADGEDALAIVNVSAAAGFTQLRRIDTATGEQTPLGSFNTLKRMTVGRDGLIYAHDGSKLYCFKPDGTLGSATSSIPIPTALAYDDAKDEIIVYSIPQKKITRLNKSFQTVDTWTIPTSFEVAGDGSVIVNPFDGSVWFDSDATDLLYRGAQVTDRQAATFTSFAVPGVVDPKGLSAGDEGTLYVSTPAGLKPVKQQATGGYGVDPTNPFFNKPVAGRLSLLRSRTNFNPLIHDGPEWQNILATDLLPIGVEVQDCVSDLDGDNTTGPADLARLLGNWGATTGNSDIDQDGVVGQADLALLLGAWGPCD